MTEDDAIRASVRIAATPETVFPYFTDPTLLIEWLGEWASLEPVPGGAFTLDFERVPVRGSYVTVEPSHRVVFTWGIAGNEALPPGSSTVEITLRAVGEDTLVELVHRGLPVARRADHATGWTLRLDALAAAAAASS